MDKKFVKFVTVYSAKPAKTEGMVEVTGIYTNGTKNYALTLVVGDERSDLDEYSNLFEMTLSEGNSALMSFKR